MKTYVVEKTDNTIAILRILDEDSDIETELKKWSPEDQRNVTKHTLVEENDVPTDYTHREAWRFTDGKIYVDAMKQAEIDLQIVYAKRAAAYPEIGDQLDAILKWVVSERFKGEELPQDLDDILGQWSAVKKKYPKPGGV